MNRAGQGVKELTEGRERSQYEDSNAAQLIGFAKAKRDIALKLGVDPYSSNEALQRELNGIAWASYAGKMTFTLATVPVSGGAGIALTAIALTATFEQAHARSEPRRSPARQPQAPPRHGLRPCRGRCLPQQHRLLARACRPRSCCISTR